MKCDACGGELLPSAVRFCGPLCETWFHEGGPEHARREVARMLGVLEMIDTVASEMVTDGLLVEGTAPHKGNGKGGRMKYGDVKYEVVLQIGSSSHWSDDETGRVVDAINDALRDSDVIPVGSFLEMTYRRTLPPNGADPKEGT